MFALGILLALQDPASKTEPPAVEVVFVLDSTGSMGHLLEGAKRKIWSIVNEIASGKPTPIVRVGFVPYRDVGDEYVTQVHDLTDDLDKAFENLKRVRAAGGGDAPEHVSRALHDAVHKISWSTDAKTFRVIFLVGDAPPKNHNDGFDYKKHVGEAIRKDIVVNAIRCGTDPATEQVWQEIARGGEGKYFSIDQTGGMTAVSTPFDKELAELGVEFAGTTVALRGCAVRKEKDEAASRRYARAAADAEAVGAPGAPPAKAEAAAGAEKAVSYRRARGNLAAWDIVQKVMDGEVKVEDLKDEQLPEEMKKMSMEERKAFIDEKIALRKSILARIADLEKKRAEYLRQEEEKRAKSGDSFDRAVIDAIAEQASKKGIEYAK